MVLWHDLGASDRNNHVDPRHWRPRNGALEWRYGTIEDAQTVAFKWATSRIYRDLYRENLEGGTIGTYLMRLGFTLVFLLILLPPVLLRSIPLPSVPPRGSTPAAGTHTPIAWPDFGPTFGRMGAPNGQGSAAI
eukprot:5657645-Pyramimonas_sp.AAC.1